MKKANDFESKQTLVSNILKQRVKKKLLNDFFQRKNPGENNIISSLTI